MYYVCMYLWLLPLSCLSPFLINVTAQVTFAEMYLLKTPNPYALKLTKAYNSQKIMWAALIMSIKHVNLAVHLPL